MVLKSKALSKAMAIGAACLALNSGISNNFTSFSNVALATKPVEGGEDPSKDQPSNWGVWYAKLIFILGGFVVGGSIGFGLGKAL